MINKMNIKKLFSISILYLINFDMGESFITVKCDEKYNISEWSCQKYEENFANNLGENLPKTLSCTGYDKFQNPDGDQPTPVLVSMQILKIQSFNIETSELFLDIQEDWTWQDQRLIWPGMILFY